MKGKHFFLKLIVSTFLILLLVYKVGLKHLYETLVGISFVYLLLAIFISLISIFLGAVNIFILIRSLGASISFLQIIRHYQMSWALGLFAPSKAGELSLLYFLKKEDISVGSSSAVFFFDKTITVLVNIVIVVIAIPFLSRVYSAYALFFLIASLIGLFVLFSSKKLVRMLLPKRFQSDVEEFYRSFSHLKGRTVAVVANTMLTVIRSLFTFLNVYLLFFAFGSRVDIFYVVVINSLLTLTSIVPFTLSGLGLREVSAVYLFSLIGVESVVTTNVYLINAAKKYVIALFIIIITKLKI